MQRRGSIIGPLILITIGVLFLLANFGYLNGSFWLTLVQFWPVILILAGLEILLGRSWQGQVVVLLVGVLAVGGVVWLVMNPNVAFPGTNAISEPVAETSDGIETANLELNAGVGDLNLAALDGTPSNWIEGTIQHPSGLRLVQDYQVATGVGRLKLDTQGTVVFLGNAAERWNLRLSPRLPIMLKVNAGVGDTKLDLNGLWVTDVNIDTGVGGMDLILPSHAGSVNAQIHGGIGGLTLRIPQGVPARIRSHAGIGGTSINQTRFPRIGEDLYQSPDYGTATDKIDLTVDAGIGGITIP